MAAPNRYGTFSSDSAWTTAGNWGGTAPQTNDVLVVRANATAIAGSDQSGTVLSEVQFAADFTGTVGSVGTPLVLTITNGTGQLLFYSGGASAYVDGVFDVVDVDTPVVQANALVLGSVGGNTNTVGILMMRRGRLTIGGDEAITTMAAAASSVDTSIVSVSTGATIATYSMAGSYTSNAGTVTTLMQSGGSFKQIEGGTVTTAHVGGMYAFNGGTTTTLNLWDGGILDLDQSTLVRTCTTINVYGGTVLAKNSPSWATTPTVNLYNPAAKLTLPFLSSVTLG